VKLEDVNGELRAALPAAVEWVGEDWEDELPYYTLPRVMEWLDSEPGEENVRAFWAFVERAAEKGDGDVHDLLGIEVFELIEPADVMDRLGPHTRTLVRRSA
jgi:hypothetical protein